MTTLLKGKSLDEAQQLFTQIHELLTGESEPEIEKLGKLAVFAGVREFPARVKCASLAWHTLNNAIKNENNLTSTE